MNGDKLYNLLPAIYRVRDAEAGSPLRGLMAILEEQYVAIEDDIEQLYRDWFIETCDEWVVPYIGDLLGLKGIEPSPDGEYSQRAFVANTIAYRRRKGTVPVIEQIARDLTQYPAKAVEFFQRLGVSQQLNHLRIDRPGLAALRSSWPASLAHTPFEQAPHHPDVRRVAAGRGKYNIPNIGIHLWRTQSFLVERSDVRPVTGHAQHFWFSALGVASPLYNRTRTDLGLEASPLFSEVPEALAWRPLYDELSQFRAGSSLDEDGVYFGRQPVFEVFIDGKAVPTTDLYVASLKDWRVPSRGVAIDVQRGLLAVPMGTKGRIQVSYSYGFPGEIGAGPYDRRRFSVADATAPDVTLYVSDSGFPDLASAVAAWDPDIDPIATIRILGNRISVGDVTIQKTKGFLRIESENNFRPALAGSLNVRGITVLELEGILFTGAISVDAKLARLDIAHSTVWPTGKPSLTVDPANRDLDVNIRRSIIGAIRAPRDMVGVALSDSIIDGSAVGYAIRSGPNQADFACPTSLDRCTVLGPISVKQVDRISESICMDTVWSERVQVGCTRFSHIPFGSQVPRRYRCQPATRYDELVSAREKVLGHKVSAAEDQLLTEEAVRQTRPRFVSLDPLSDSYALLSPNCPCAIERGAEDEGEMGAWHTLHQARRLRHLDAALEEYVRFGMEAGVFFEHSTRGLA
ncbi:MAG: hypothetical protein ACOYON_02245 [Fimbriimonas sp.]